MERARHRKSKSASGIEGIRQTQKQKYTSRLSSDSQSYFDGSHRDDMIMLEFGQANAMPMKKLLAEEMSREIEAKKRTPNVIARLMGLEGMPSPRHPLIQPKRITDNYQQQKNVSVNLRENIQLYDGLSNRRSSTDQHEFKDVFVDLEASHVGNRRCSSRWRESSILTKQEMDLIRQKFIDAKRLSTDEKFQDSKELDDALEILDSNKHILLKFLQQPESLFDSGSSGGRHISVSKPSNLEKYENKAKAWRLEKNTSSKHHTISHVKRQDGLLLESHNRHRTRISRHPSRIQLENKTEENVLPTRIVVLKPNIGMMQKDDAFGSLSNLSHYYQTRRNSPCDVGSSKPISNEAREIAREITRRMRYGWAETKIEGRKSTQFKDYAGDESSCDVNGSDSESEAEMLKLSCRKTFNDNNLSRYPHSRLGKSSVNSEGKKRLSERWEMAQNYQDLEIVSKANTLGEMLSLPDNEAIPCHISANVSLDKPNNQAVGINGTAMLSVPIGISSKDGWRDDIRRDLSRSKSLPPSTCGRSYRRSKVVKGNHSPKDHSFTDSVSRSKMSHLSPRMIVNDTDPTSKADFEIPMEANAKSVLEQQSMFQMDARSPLIGEVMILEPGSPTSPSKSSDFPMRFPENNGNKSSGHDQEDSNIQKIEKEPCKQGSPFSRCLRAEPDSSESSKEADHPSPVSVLEVPFTEDVSSCESFERVGAELHELRKQLQLLKMESGSHSVASCLLPIEEESVQLSPVLSEGNDVAVAGNWESCYVIDVLIDSGLEANDFKTWHSSDCPLNPNLFENLEKKYSDSTAEPRPERRLLFDRINSAMFEIFYTNVDSCPWVSPKLAGLNLHATKEDVYDALEKLLQYDFANEEMSNRMLDREMEWAGDKGEIDLIGTEIEKLLVDEMITEVVRCM